MRSAMHRRVSRASLLFVSRMETDNDKYECEFERVADWQVCEEFSSALAAAALCRNAKM
jgi:hypothetical protein